MCTRHHDKPMRPSFRTRGFEKNVILFDTSLSDVCTDKTRKNDKLNGKKKIDESGYPYTILTLKLLTESFTRAPRSFYCSNKSCHRFFKHNVLHVIAYTAPQTTPERK